MNEGMSDSIHERINSCQAMDAELGTSKTATWHSERLGEDSGCGEKSGSLCVFSVIACRRKWYIGCGKCVCCNSFLK
jgi:hypothetical protein